ncbi:MAG: hypothetical protein LBB41_00050, partial [Prevotellaceae bacterium]|nr:hypothetical protein [Prevotellaceae bacterium]
LKIWCKNRNIIAKSNTELIEYKEITELFKKEIKEYNAHFGDYERIKNFRLIADEWTADNFLSQTLKTKRKVIENHYKTEIEAMFM